MSLKWIKGSTGAQNGTPGAHGGSPGLIDAQTYFRVKMILPNLLGSKMLTGAHRGRSGLNKIVGINWAQTYIRARMTRGKFLGLIGRIWAPWGLFCS